MINRSTSYKDSLFSYYGNFLNFFSQIDPFGMSNCVHGQFAQMGFDATVISRIPFELKGRRKKKKLPKKEKKSSKW